MERPYLKAFQCVVGRRCGKDEKAARICFSKLLRRFHTAHAVHVNIQKRGGEALLFFCREKGFSAVKFQKLRLCAAKSELPRQALFQPCALIRKIIHNCDPHVRIDSFVKNSSTIISQLSSPAAGERTDFVPESGLSCQIP